MPEVEPSGVRDLLSAVEHAHQAALAVLDDPEQHSLGAVAWLSVHLAAVDRVLYREAERAVPDGVARVTGQLRTDHLLVQALWRLDRRLTGDVHHRASSQRALEEEVRELLAAHADGERALLHALSTARSDEELQGLTADLEKAMLRCPTRPHPDVPRGRRTSGAMSWMEGVVDRARDLMDSRHVPTPRREPVLPKATRWGSYGTAGTWRPEPDEHEHEHKH